MLTPTETKRLAALLKKIDKPHEGLPQPVFDAIVKIVPFVACEVVIESKDGLLLKWRDDKWWHGWHFPGGLLRFGESFEERIQNVAWNELGVKINDYEFLYVENCNHGERGHVLSLVFICHTEGEPQEGKFFKKMPKNIIPGHKILWKRIKKIKKD